MTVNAVNTYVVPTTANEVTMPSQPAFLAYLGAGDTDLNVTGNGAIYVLGGGNALTEVFDQNADFNTNGTFTAPVTGRYFLAHSVNYLQGAGATSAHCDVNTSNRIFVWQSSADITAAADGSIRLNVLTDMDAADTATIQIVVEGLPGDTVDIQGSATLYSFYSGYLVV